MAFCDIHSLSSLTLVSVNISIKVRRLIGATGDMPDSPGELSRVTSSVGINVLQPGKVECSVEFSLPKYASTAAEYIEKLCSFGPVYYDSKGFYTFL